MIRWLLSASALLAACIPAGDSAKFAPSNTSEADMSVSDSANNAQDTGLDQGTTATQPDAAMDVSQDVEDDVTACVPEGTEALCAKIAVECGTARGEDNCAQTRDVYCGSCVFGTGCSSGECIETECRDNMDNDNDDAEDCADPDCLDQRCSRADNQKRCQNDGSCN